MTQTLASQVLPAMNFIVGFALLVMLFPVSGKAAEKPTGVRTAIELIDKRGSKSVCLSALRA